MMMAQKHKKTDSDMKNVYRVMIWTVFVTAMFLLVHPEWPGQWHWQVKNTYLSIVLISPALITGVPKILNKEPHESDH